MLAGGDAAAEAPQQQGARVWLLTGPRGTYHWQYASGHKATTGRDEAGTQLRAVDPSKLSPTPAVEEAKSEKRRNPTTIGTAARLGGQVNGDQKGQLTLRTCPHQPCSKEERYRQSHLGPHLSSFHCAPRVPFSFDAREGILASEPVVRGVNVENACAEKG
jgi:hypothetical protein